MLKIEIYDHTPHNMLRAIRAACNELLGETHADPTAQAAQHNSRAVELHAAAEVETGKAAAALSAHNQTAPTVAEMIQAGHLPAPTVAIGDEAHLKIPAPSAEELDSAGHAWNPELHASTKAKNQDGTWKKRRGAAQVAVGTDSKPEVEEMLAEQYSPTPAPPVPPAPAAPTSEGVMKKIFALITAQVCTLNDVLDAAAEHGIADLGQNGLTGASIDVQTAVLRKLEGAA